MNSISTGPIKQAAQKIDLRLTQGIDHHMIMGISDFAVSGNKLD
jgi:hypothetical protein